MSNTSERRSATMRAIRKSGTGLEARFAAILQALGFADFEQQARDLPGTPDFVYRDRSLAIFLDSCYWHGCPQHLRMPSSNDAYWQAKIAKNRERDARQSAELKQAGWEVERIWEHELREPDALRARLIAIMRG